MNQVHPIHQKKTLLTDNEALNIIKEYCSDNISINDLTEKYKIHSNNKIKNILQRRSFWHLDIGELKNILYEKIKKEVTYKTCNDEDIVNIFNEFIILKNISQVS